MPNPAWIDLSAAGALRGRVAAPAASAVRDGRGGDGDGSAGGFASSVLRERASAAASAAVRSPEKEKGADDATVAVQVELQPAADAAVASPEPDVLRGPVYTAAEVFQCQEESLFYSQVLEKMLPVVTRREALRRNGSGARSGSGAGGGWGWPSQAVAGTSGADPAAAEGGAQPQAGETRSLKVVEFGTGDGKPVISALMKTSFDGVVYGFELNPISASLARDNAGACGLSEQYQITTGCFYKGTSAPSSPAAGAVCLIANPPYLPAPDSNILMPELHGGADGAELTRDLLSLGFPYVVLLVASFSNPASVLHHAAAEGYRVVDFQMTPLPFGTYSSEPKASLEGLDDKDNNRTNQLETR
ncbi:hypothetical protein PLESTB_001119200 [Pleodorina starrii]|uniref:Uncharacterized protein n=1 Tax=Pleodorina starrii TaxID=330485 RepID=A0A9W6F4U0_9CHLO|nr:hypothetical protein PLESTM_001356500 [Pleodorina starrii]GLC56548.1 hypothetical protein PLESTB_001119200 [Pleodorina starrii]GLC68791.1 hypothetical protein PLESTF_000737100 [Pleodorina starrii]